MVSTHLKNISQNGNLPQIGMKIKNVWNNHPAIHFQYPSLNKKHPRFILWIPPMWENNAFFLIVRVSAAEHIRYVSIRFKLLANPTRNMSVTPPTVQNCDLKIRKKRDRLNHKSILYKVTSCFFEIDSLGFIIIRYKLPDPNCVCGFEGYTPKV